MKYLGHTDILEIKRDGENMGYFSQSFPQYSAKKPPLPASECNSCMQDCSGMEGSLYDSANAPGMPFMYVNSLLSTRNYASILII